jgi:hypothetical protein
VKLFGMNEFHIVGEDGIVLRSVTADVLTISTSGSGAAVQERE